MRWKPWSVAFFVVEDVINIKTNADQLKVRIALCIDDDIAANWKELSTSYCNDQAPWFNSDYVCYERVAGWFRITVKVQLSDWMLMHCSEVLLRECDMIWVVKSSMMDGWQVYLLYVSDESLSLWSGYRERLQFEFDLLYYNLTRMIIGCNNFWALSSLGLIVRKKSLLR